MKIGTNSSSRTFPAETCMKTHMKTTLFRYTHTVHPYIIIINYQHLHRSISNHILFSEAWSCLSFLCTCLESGGCWTRFRRAPGDIDAWVKLGQRCTTCQQQGGSGREHLGLFIAHPSWTGDAPGFIPCHGCGTVGAQRFAGDVPSCPMKGWSTCEDESCEKEPHNRIWHGIWKCWNWIWKMPVFGVSIFYMWVFDGTKIHKIPTPRHHTFSRVNVARW